MSQIMSFNSNNIRIATVDDLVHITEIDVPQCFLRESIDAGSLFVYDCSLRNTIDAYMILNFRYASREPHHTRSHGEPGSSDFSHLLHIAVRPGRRERGLGSIMVNYWINMLVTSSVNVVSLSATFDSRGFWNKMGFILNDAYWRDSYINDAYVKEKESYHFVRIIPRKLFSWDDDNDDDDDDDNDDDDDDDDNDDDDDDDADKPQINTSHLEFDTLVAIEWYSETDHWNMPFNDVHLRAAQHNGKLLLPERVICPFVSVPITRGDICVRVFVDNIAIYSNKAKRPTARTLGVKRDGDEYYYFDYINPPAPDKFPIIEINTPVFK